MAATETQTVHELFREQARARGAATAVQGLDAKDLSYDALIEQVQAVIQALSAWGIGRGDRVMISLPNGPEAFVALHSLSSMAVAMPVDLAGSATEFEHFLRFAQPKAVILQQGIESAGRGLAQQYGARVIDLIPTPKLGAGTFTFAEAPPASNAVPALNGLDDTAFLLTTSGTTALPKLVPITQRAILKILRFQFETQTRVTGETTPIRTLNFLSLNHMFGLTITLGSVVSGGAAACMPRFDPERVFDWLDVYRPTFLAALPAVLEQIVARAPNYPEILSRHSVRYLFTATSALSEAARAGLGRFLGVPIVQTYGMTEVGTIARLISPAGAAAPPSAVGLAAEPENTRIMASDGSFLPTGEVGEIVIRSDIFAGYWNNPGATQDALAGDWFRTGDQGYLDESGSVFILGRVKEVINSGGAKVSPHEVESVLKQHPGVTDAVVFGFPHAEIGEAVAAAVVGTASERDLRKFAAERLPFYKVPMRIILVDAIPVAASGKVQRNRLAEQLGLL